MTAYNIVANQSGFQTANGDYIFIAPNVSVTGGIDMRGYGDADPNTLGGDQTVFVMGTLLGGLNRLFNDHIRRQRDLYRGRRLHSHVVYCHPAWRRWQHHHK